MTQNSTPRRNHFLACEVDVERGTTDYTSGKAVVLTATDDYPSRVASIEIAPAEAAQLLRALAKTLGYQVTELAAEEPEDFTGRSMAIGRLVTEA